MSNDRYKLGASHESGVDDDFCALPVAYLASLQPSPSEWLSKVYHVG